MFFSYSSALLSIIDEQSANAVYPLIPPFSCYITSALVTICHIIHPHGHFFSELPRNRDLAMYEQRRCLCCQSYRPLTTASHVNFFLFKLLRPLQFPRRPHLTPTQTTRQNCLAGSKGRPATVLPHPCQYSLLLPNRSSSAVAGSQNLHIV
jgi:hypothetical protein